MVFGILDIVVDDDGEKESVTLFLVRMLKGVKVEGSRTGTDKSVMFCI